MTHGMEKSDSAIVAMKPANKAGMPAAEWVEPRAGTNPFNRAEWTLMSLHGRLEKYFFEERPNRPHPALGMTPNEFEAHRTLETGERTFRCVHFDENLLLMTSPHPKIRHHRVDRQRGVWVGGIWFNHPALKNLPPRTKVEIRIEPWHASVVYVCVAKSWVTAVGNCPRWLASRTSREVEIMLREERRRATHTASQASVAADKRGSMQRLWTPQDFDPRLAEQQRETRHLYEALGMTVALPSAREHIKQDTSKSPPAQVQPNVPMPSTGGAQSIQPTAPAESASAPVSAIPVPSTAMPAGVVAPNTSASRVLRTGRFN